MPRFEPAPEDDHAGRDFEQFPEIAAALDDLARPKPLGPDTTATAPGGRLTPEEVEARLEQEDGDAGGEGEDLSRSASPPER